MKLTKIKKNTMAAVAGALCLTAYGCQNVAETTASYDIVPLPAKIETIDEAPFKLTNHTVITYTPGDTALAENAHLLAGYIKTLTGRDLKITDTGRTTDAIELKSSLDAPNPEAYELQVSPDHITIDGASAAGNYYGINALRKSIAQTGDYNVIFPAVKITDAPRFPYRGVHLDVSRHFFPADSVKTYIDMAALHNINRLHLHLTDDQGWRIEIKKHPKLTELGGMRNGTMQGTDFNSTDNQPYGGYYTQEEARELVDYAAKRHITIVPEIDMPGHMLGALKAYPQYGCTGGPYEVWEKWGISEEVLCAGNDSVYELIDDILKEITDIFPSEYVHIGGDECPKTRWHECKKCQAKIKALKLKDDAHSTAEQKLQAHFMRHAANTLAGLGRKAVGWDEILEGDGANENTIIMSWRGIKGATQAARTGHDAILTPTRYCYFDYLQAPDSITDEIHLPYRTYLPIDTVYAFEPIPQGLTEEEARHILGAQANVWTEYIPTFSYAQYKTLPRLAAMSEVQWTDPTKKDFSDFKRRLKQLTVQYDAEGYNYATFVFSE